MSLLTPVSPSSSYSQDNESQFRRQAKEADASNLKRDIAISSFLMTNDDGSIYEITLVAGVLTATAVPV